MMIMINIITIKIWLPIPTLPSLPCHPYLHCLLSFCQMMPSSLIGHPALHLHATALEFRIWNAFPHSVHSGPRCLD